MWPFKPKENDLVSRLRGYKKITIEGMRFTIKKINPFLDFQSDRIPTIFTDFISARKVEPAPLDSAALKKHQEDMYAIIKAGVVEPDLGSNGITVEDLFRDMDLGVKLYLTILDHSLNRFRGLKKLFFSIKTKYSLYIKWQKLSKHYQAQLSLADLRPIEPHQIPRPLS